MKKTSTPNLDKLTATNYETIRKGVAKRMKALLDAGKKGLDFWESMSLDDRAVFIAHDTVRFGRPLRDAIVNARTHIENDGGRAFAISSARPDPEACMSVKL